MATPLAAPYAAVILTPADWARLADTPLGQSMPEPLDEASGFVLAVEDANGMVVATWAAYGVVHLEGCWIAPTHRKSPSLIRVAVAGMFAELRRRGLTQVLTVTQTDEVADLARHLGGVAAGTLWVIPVPEET